MHPLRLEFPSTLFLCHVDTKREIYNTGFKPFKAVLSPQKVIKQQITPTATKKPKRMNDRIFLTSVPNIRKLQVCDLLVL